VDEDGAVVRKKTGLKGTALLLSGRRTRAAMKRWRGRSSGKILTHSKIEQQWTLSGFKQDQGFQDLSENPAGVVYLASFLFTGDTSPIPNLFE
jgi:hypothetical protein